MADLRRLKKHEPVDISALTVLKWAVAVAVLLYGTIAGIALIYNGNNGGSLPRGSTPTNERPPEYGGPRFETQRRAEIERLRGIAHTRLEEGPGIPIDEAMKAVVARGADAYAPLVSDAPDHDNKNANGNKSGGGR